MGGMYPSTASGLYECYVAAIPLFGATLVGDLLWTAALSLVYAAIAKRRAWLFVPNGQVAAI